MVKKGNIPWNKGLKGIYSEDVLKSNSDKHKSSYEERYGKEGAKLVKEKIRIKMKERKLSDIHKERIGKANKNKLKGKTMEEIHGVEKTKEIKKKIGDNNWSKRMKGKFPKKTLLKKKFNMSGENNPMFGHRGELAPNWLGGLKCLPYDKNFNKHFKLLIKKRDNFTCLKCNLNEVDHKQLYCKQGLVIHHIDYNKENSSEENCCTLCHRCHGETNFNRSFWTIFFRSILSQRYGYKYKKGETIK